MSRTSSVCLALVAGAVLMTAAPEAAAQCRLCMPGEGAAGQEAPARPVALEVQTNLDFDKVILTSAAGGMARLQPDGSRGTSGALQPLSGRAMVGSVVIRGEPGRAVLVGLPSRIELFGSSGGRITIERVSSDLSAEPRLDSTGQLEFRFGGELRVTGDAEGDYRGDIPITVEYF